MQEILNELNDRVLAVGFSGVVSFCEGDTELYHRAYGYRDVANGLGNNTETRFGIASGTKFITALGIGRLIDQGKLSLETKVTEIDSSFHTFIDGDATILHLLTHTSGVYDYFDEEVIEDFDNFHVEIPWYRLETPSDYLPLFSGQEMKFEPGARYSYSNGGYVLLGIIIEKVSGRLYRDFLEEEVLIPAGMDHSGFYAFNNLPENTAWGYLADGETSNIFSIPKRGGGDGGMYTTAGDLRLLWKNLFSYKILSEELTNFYLSTQTEINDQIGYGCGIYKTLDDGMYFIVGGDAGVGFDSRHIPSRSLTVTVVSNRTDGEEDIRNFLLNRLFQKS